MPTFDSDRSMTLLGVSGRLTHRTTKPDGKPGLWFKQRWISEARNCPSFGEGVKLRTAIRFDDECGNGHNSFAITGDAFKVDTRGRRHDIAGGCLHDEITSVFPELAPLIKWHLTSTDGPMHYLQNTVYLAGDRDCWGLRAGEKRPLVTRDGAKMWELVAVNSLGVALSSTPTGLEYRGAETVPLFILEKNWTGENPPAVPKLEWRRACRTGEGKARDLEAARRVAVWPDAADAMLSAEPNELRAALQARLPDLIAEFRRAMESAGFLWEPPQE